MRFPDLRRCAEAMTRAAMLAMVLLHGGLHAAQPAPAAEKAPPVPPVAESVTDAVTLITSSEELQRTTLDRLKEAQQWRDLDRETEAQRAAFEKLTATGAINATAPAALTDLIELEFQLRDIHGVVSATVDGLSAIARRLESDQNGLESNVKIGQERIAFAQERGAPPPVLERGRAIETQLQDTIARVRQTRDDVLLALDRALVLRGRIDDARAILTVQRTRAQADVVQQQRGSLWQLLKERSHFELVVAEVSTGYRLVRDYLVKESAVLAAWFFAVLLLTYWLFTRRPNREAEPAERAYGGPLAASVLIALMALWWLAPAPPVYFYAALLTLVPIPAALVARRSFAKPIPLTVFGIALATTLFPLRGVLEASVIAGRAVLLLQAASIAVPVAVDLRSRRLFQAFPSFSRGTVRGAALIIIAASALAFGAAIIGFVGPARSVRAALGGVLGFGMVFGASAVTLYGALLAFLDTPLGQCLRIGRTRDPDLLRAVRFVLGALVVAGLVIVVVGSLQPWPTVLSAVSSYANGTLELGTVAVSVRSVGSAVGVVLATLALIALVGFMLDREIVPRLRLRPGTGYAISTLTRWTIVIVGAVLTLGALGIDMTKVTLLAGALGIGIGFGLQNIVNNFVSGLILIVERPVYLGDLIEVGPLLGEVKRIGIRSSTVRTMQGAEVIVPNSDLVAKEVVNWTRSDRQRRYDIDVGVAYGSDPEQVLRVLEEAAKEVPEIMVSPPPLAMFVGFGDSWLNFRLLAWVQTIDVGPQAATALRIAILRKLGEAGIAIPFPQRDLHVYPANALPPAEQGPRGAT